MPDTEALTAIDAEHIRGLKQGAAINLKGTPRLATKIVGSARKRAFDVTVSILLLLLFFPFLLAAIIGIKLESNGPVLFTQRRTGLGGKVFTIFKFRTMHVLEDAHDITQASQNDPRITRLGTLLRRTSIDELPQLINVLRGDMSIVGPRPHAIAHDINYGHKLPHYALRFRVRPGLTGLAQVSSLRGETRDIDDMAHRISVDNFYIDHWRFYLDVIILFRTATLFLLTDQNAY